MEKTIKILKYDEFIKKINVVIDQQEKKNYWITNYFDDIGVKYIKKHMKAFDYTYTLDGKAQPVVIERKNSLTELSSNLASKEMRDRFYREFNKLKCKKWLLIENDSMDNLIGGLYGGGYHPNSFLANLMLLQTRFLVNVHFINKYSIGMFMLKIFYYHYYEQIKNQNGEGEKHEDKKI
jgi:hypothetical protein